MNKRLLATLNAGLFVTALTLTLAPSGGHVFADDAPGAKAPAAPATEDVIFMTDGRELHGQIVSKTRTQVVFEYKDAKLNMKTKLTLSMDDIVQIKEDVALDTAAPAEEPGAAKPVAPAAAASGTKKTPEVQKSYGAAQVKTDDPKVPSIYIVPMRGQMGTDVMSPVYEKVRDDIRARKPDMVVIEMDCQDIEDVLYSEKGKEETGIADMDDFRKLVNLFQDDLRDVKQVCWIHDSVGISSVVAMTWSKMFMKPTARLGGMIAARDQTGFESWQDDDVRGKMTAAFMGWIQGFLIGGHYDTVLADAMVRPQFMLSATWKGREVIWSKDDKGEYLVDGNPKKTAEFRAKDAEDLCLSKGTAESLDDLALLLGYREYRVLDGNAEKLVTDYHDDWRRAYEDCKVFFEDYQQQMGWASGADAVKYLGKAKTSLEKILSAMDRYKACEIRLGREYGVNKTQLFILIDQIKERLRAMKASGAGGGGSGVGGGGAGGRGPGSPGGGRGPGGR